MGAVGRRSLLMFSGMAPVAAPALGSAATMQLAGIEVAGGVAGMMSQPSTGNVVGANKPLRFLSFASWLKDIGHERIKRDADVVRFIDADIACMSLPLNTKIQWQRERNYKRLLEQEKSWFERKLLSNGTVEYWL